MTLQQLAELGYVCGLDTLREAACNAECHWDAFPQPDAFIELNREIEQAAEYDIGFDMLCVHFLGAERCAQLDAELDAALEMQSDSDNAVTKLRITLSQIAYVDLKSGECPDCKHGDFHAGPRGGCAINVKCARCGSCFNYCGVLPSHRIEEVPGVYSKERRRLRTLP